MKGATVTSGYGPLGFDDSVGVEPDRLHIGVSATLQQAKPRAGTIFKACRGHGARWRLWDTDRRRESKPRSQSRRTRISPPDLLPSFLYDVFLMGGAINPTKINRGRRLDEQARGPDRSEMIDHPPREQTCEGRYEPQERRRTTRGKDQSFGQAAKARSW
jgi:hypothetical protein